MLHYVCKWGFCTSVIVEGRKIPKKNIYWIKIDQDGQLLPNLLKLFNFYFLASAQQKKISTHQEEQAGGQGVGRRPWDRLQFCVERDQLRLSHLHGHVHPSGGKVNFSVFWVFFSQLLVGFRTARGWNKGTAISLVGPEERKTFRCIQEEINSQSNFCIENSLVCSLLRNF